METIKNMMTGVSSDKRILVLILAWGFGGFLEAIAGFGTAVAIPAGIMASLGFNPISAAVMCLIANTTPTAFGAIGLPVTTLAQVTDLNVMQLSFTVSIQLFILILIIPFALVMITGGGVKAIKDVYKRQEQQRVAIARALAKRPKLLLCDEPTGALDYSTGKNILKLLQDTCRREKMTVALITHNQAITPMADRVIKMKNGKVEDMYLNAEPMPVELIEW